MSGMTPTQSQAGTVACRSDKHERLEELATLLSLFTHRSHSTPHAWSEGKKVGIGVSLVRRAGIMIRASSATGPDVEDQVRAVWLSDPEL